MVRTNLPKTNDLTSVMRWLRRFGERGWRISRQGAGGLGGSEAFFYAGHVLAAHSYVANPAREQATVISLPARWGVRASCSSAAQKLGGGRNPRSCDPIGLLTAAAPAIASLRRSAACAEA